MNQSASDPVSNGRAILLAIVAFVLLLVGLATVDARITVLAIPPLLFLAAALITRGTANVDLHLQREVGKPTIWSGNETAVTLRLTNNGSAFERVYVTDTTASALELVSGDAEALAALGPGDTLELAYVVRAPRGLHDLRDVLLTGGETLDLFPSQFALTDHTQLTALPEARRVRDVPIRPLATRGFAGPIIARRSGSGTDFFGVREYRMGDPLRHVNWRAMARHGDQPYTTEFNQEQIADIGIVLDVRPQQAFVVNDESLLEYSIQAAAGISQALLAVGHRVSLLQYGNGSFVRAGYGRAQQGRILHALAATGSTPVRAFYSLKWLPTQLFPPRSQMMFVSPLLTEEHTMLFRLRSFGYAVSVISPNPIEFEAVTLDINDPLVPLAVRLARIERRLHIRKLQQGGVHVVDWNISEDLNRAIQRVLRPTLQAQPPLLRGIQ